MAAASNKVAKPENKGEGGGGSGQEVLLKDMTDAERYEAFEPDFTPRTRHGKSEYINSFLSNLVAMFMAYYVLSLAMYFRYTSNHNAWIRSIGKRSITE